MFVAFRFVALALLLAAAAPRADAARRDVLLVVNARVPDGAAIAETYRVARDIPASHVVSIDVDPAESIARREFLTRIQAPIGEWINRQAAHDDIVHIVLFRGVPLKVAPDAASRFPLVSVDSSLSLLYRVLLGVPVGPGPIQNPYFTAAPGAAGMAGVRSAGPRHLPGQPPRRLHCSGHGPVGWSLHRAAAG